MSSWDLRRGAIWLMLISALILSGCSGGNSTAGEEDTTLVAQTYSEQCTLCHRAGSIQPVADVHTDEESATIDGEITGVNIDVDGNVTISFDIFDSENHLIPVAGVSSSSIRFTIDQLVYDAVDDTYDWQSYINDEETVGNSTEVQATSERANTSGGEFIDNDDGSYSYKMSFQIDAVTSPITVTYDGSLTHRVGMQLSGNTYNAIYNFIPNGGTPVSNASVTNSACNECHIALGFHGGDRITTDFCVTCHNPGSTDANSGNTVDFKVMIHKIHAGESLPEVEAGGEYVIYGHNDSRNDYSTVVFPQDLRNCTKCHENSSAAPKWKNEPSTAACTSCHEAPDPTDYPTFPNLTATEIEDAHEIPAQIAGEAFEYNIVSITNTGPGERPVVIFNVVDPTNSDAAYDILNDAPFTATSTGTSRLAVLIAWPGKDYTNAGSGSTPAEPVSIDPLSAGVATDNGDGNFTVTSPVAIPASVTGSGAVVIEGHPAAALDSDGIYNDRIPVTSVVKAFAITDPSPVARRTVVSIDNCDQCHGQLSLHGGNRTDNIQVCVVCHNADATDIGVRPASGTADGKVEEAIDFKYMIHAIHAGDDDYHGFREDGIIIYGFRSSVNDFSEVRLPSGEDNLRNCTGCHTGTTYAVPLNSNVLPTTILTNSNLSSPHDDTNITPTASVCSSCHDAIDAKTHISEQGGEFDFVPYLLESTTESSGSGDAALCGPGAISDQPAGHTTRTDCCSCHAIQ